MDRGACVRNSVIMAGVRMIYLLVLCEGIVNTGFVGRSAESPSGLNSL